LEQEKKQKSTSKNFNSALERIVELTAETVLRTFSGVIILLILDGLLGLIAGSPFMVTKELYRVVVELKEGFGSTETLITIYALLWGWGRVVYILRQLILDRVKGDYLIYLDEEKKEETMKFYKELRKKVLEKLKREFGVELPQSDYLIYNFLGKILSSETSKRRTKDADEIAFLAININLIVLLVALIYTTCLLKVLYTHCSYAYEVIACTVPELLITALSHTAWFLEVFCAYYAPPCVYEVIICTKLKIFTILVSSTIIVLLTIKLAKVFVAKRLISRNLKLYINYLYLSKDSNG